MRAGRTGPRARASDCGRGGAGAEITAVLEDAMEVGAAVLGVACKATVKEATP